MKKYFYRILIIHLIITSCQKRTAYEKNGWTKEKFQPEMIEMTKASFDGSPIILPINQLTNIYGKPKEIKKNCDIILVDFDGNKKNYDCWAYDYNWNIVFKVDENQAFLGIFKFEKTSLKIVTPQITLSKKTTLKDLKNVFPISYSHRNIGANHLRVEGYQWIYLKSDLQENIKNNNYQIMLVFKDNHLKWLEYQPE